MVGKCIAQYGASCVFAPFVHYIVFTLVGDGAVGRVEHLYVGIDSAVASAYICQYAGNYRVVFVGLPLVFYIVAPLFYDVHFFWAAYVYVDYANAVASPLGEQGVLKCGVAVERLVLPGHNSATCQVDVPFLLWLVNTQFINHYAVTTRFRYERISYFCIFCICFATEGYLFTIVYIFGVFLEFSNDNVHIL